MRAMGEGGPDLLPIDDKVVAIEDRARLDGGEIGTRARLGHSLAPDFLARNNRFEVALFLLLGTPLHERGSAHDDAEDVDAEGHADASELLLKDNLLDESGFLAAVFFGPSQAHPAALIETLVPLLKTLPLAIVAAHTVGVGRLGFGGLIGFQPATNLRTIGFLFGRILKIHRLVTLRELAVSL